MKKQVVLVRGGEDKSNYSDYIDFLNSYEYEPFPEIKKRWSVSLDESLGDNYEVYNHKVFNKDFSDYTEWKIMFEKILPFLKDGVIFVGHSLGATFLAKYLSESNINIQIKALFLVAPAFKDSSLEKLGSFNFNPDFDLLNKQVDKTYLIGSKDDFVVPFDDIIDFENSNLDIYKSMIFEDKGHFLQEDFSELVDEVKKL